MKRALTPNEVLFNVDLNEDDDNKIRLKDIPEITSAYEKIKRAISIDEEGYNLYIIDSFSKDKLENLTKFIENLYKSAEAPRDICYATINDPKRPEPIFLTNGNNMIINLLR